MSAKTVSRTLAVAAALLWAMPSLGCPVCFGDTDSPMARAANLSILFMVIVTYVVIVGGVVTVFMLRLKARRRALEAAAVTADS